MSGVDSDLIRGHIDTIILKVLSEGDKYGYEICKEVEEKSNGTYELKQPTLYSCLKRLESQGLISSYWKDSDIGGKRHYYKLTKKGKDTYKNNQEEWMRSRQIIDNLISNTYEEASSYSLIKKDEIEELEKKAEKLAEELEEVKENSENDILDEQESTTTLSFDDGEIIPWGVASDNEEVEKSEEIEDNIKSDYVYFENKLNEIDENKLDDMDFSIEDENKEDNNNIPEAQATIFEESDNVIFEENDETEEVEEDDESFDIMELLGHTTKQIEHTSTPLLEEPKEEKETKELALDPFNAPAIEETNELAIVNESEDEDEVKPFNFRMEDFMMKTKTSYFESEEKESLSYNAPEMKIDNTNTESSINDEEIYNNQEVDDKKFSFEEYKLESFRDESQMEDEVFSENTESSPVYNDYSASEFLNNFDHKIEENDDDEIYQPTEAKNEKEEYKSLFEEEGLKLFSEDLFEDNDLAEDKPKQRPEIFDKEVTIIDNTELEVATEKTSNAEIMDFYKSTENYNSLTPKFTEGEYKEKLGSLMEYSGVYEKEKSSSPSLNNLPKDYHELKAEFEKEGLKVKPHVKMVKEAKSTRSYIESNKLNLVNSWTSFGIVAFIISLVCIIMSNYNDYFSDFNAGYKYFLIGIAGLMIIPIVYTIIFFINPYKKKPARYASRVYLLFAILIIVQFLIIIYCVNLQMGFYSFTQENYNHLLWIVPSLMSLYPLVDALLHTVYFNSKNFHV